MTSNKIITCGIGILCLASAISWSAPVNAKDSEAVFDDSAPAPAEIAKPTSSGKISVAIMPLKYASGISGGDADLIADRLRSELFNTGLATLTEREKVLEILKKQGLQQSGSCSDESCLSQTGQLLGAQAVISGSIAKTDSGYTANLKIIDVRYRASRQVVSENIKGKLADVLDRLPGIAARLLGKNTLAQMGNQEIARIEAKEQITEPVVQPQKQPAAPVAQPLPQPPAPAAQTAPQRPVSAKPAKDTTDIIFEGGEESLFDESESLKKAQAQSAKDAMQGAKESKTAGSDSLKPVASSASEAITANPPKGPVQKPAISAKVEDVRSVNFSNNVKEYRSPKLAMLLSLLLPGAGQAYAGNYVKTSIFVAIEAVIVGVSVGYSIKGKNEREAAHGFADEHFLKGKFLAYYDSLDTFFTQFYRDKGDPFPGDTAALRMQEIFWAPDGEDFKTNISRLMDGRTSDFYNQYINSKSFVQGWDDCDPTFNEIHQAGYSRRFVSSTGKTYTVHDVPDSAYLVGADTLAPSSQHPGVEPIYGYSFNQVKYIDWLSSANGYYRTAGSILYLLLVNHLGSAIDAGITAKQHNDRLLKKQSLWSRVNLYPICLNTGNEIAPGYAVRILF